MLRWVKYVVISHLSEVVTWRCSTKNLFYVLLHIEQKTLVLVYWSHLNKTASYKSCRQVVFSYEFVTFLELLFYRTTLAVCFWLNIWFGSVRFYSINKNINIPFKRDLNFLNFLIKNNKISKTSRGILFAKLQDHKTQEWKMKQNLSKALI